MKFYSTRSNRSAVSLKEAVLRGLPEDNGLYMPAHIPYLNGNFWQQLPAKSFQEQSFAIAKHLLGDSLPEASLKEIIDEAINFDAPLIQISDQQYVLELFHGPTLAFKDFAARFMAKLMGHYVRDIDTPLSILVATSGDTGSAVANGFLDVPGIQVFILYPSRKVSFIQEQQLTTLGKNITSLEIEGTFDDCQQMVKTAFLDSELRQRYLMTSANSINIARLIPQTFYYVHAFARLSVHDHPIVFSVPSGNFGNLTAGLLTKKMGLPVEKFIAATNINDIVPTYLQKGIFAPRASQQTLSNAMDVGNPSNFSRIQALYANTPREIHQDIIGYSYTDAQTISAIQTVYRKHSYIIDPHSAIAYSGLTQYQRQQTSRAKGVFLATAHPVKFKDIVEDALETTIALPPQLKETLTRTKQAIQLPGHFKALKSFLLDQ